MKPELLLPAGNPEAFAAAIDGGADADYINGWTGNDTIIASDMLCSSLI